MSGGSEARPRALVETMLAVDGAVPWLTRHLARMEASARALELGWPGRAALTDAIAAAVSAAGPRARVRLVLGPDGVRAEAAAEPEPAWEGAPAVSLRGAWDPALGAAEHKALPRERWDRAQTAARAAGAAHALLLDRAGRLGEAAVGNVFAVVAGQLVTAPVRGLLPGIARAVVIERMAVREEALAEADWRSAAELFLTNAVRGVVPLTSVDERPVGDGRPGPVAAAARHELRRPLS